MEFSAKQQEALIYLESVHYKDVSDVFFGGAAGGGKTYLGCLWQIARRLKYPGTRGLIGRAKLKNLKLTTLITFFEVWNMFFEGKQEITINLNHQDNVIYFSNGSMIFLKDLFFYPSDPDFTSLGSMEITDAFFDEVTEITEKAYTIACSRIRYKCINDAPKALSAGNPSTNWVKTRFVIDADSRPVKLKEYERFVASTLEDNPDEKFKQIYRKQLEKLPMLDRMRLLHGDWTIIDNDNPFFYEFDYNSNTLPDIPMRDDVALILSFDFNVNPCTAVLGYQVHGEGNYWIKEFSVKGGTRSLLQQMDFIRQLSQPLRITGDNSGHSRSSSSVTTDFQIIEEYFRLRVEGRTKKANGSHLHSKTVSNHMLYNVPCFISRKGCPQLINQILAAKQTKDGKLVKDDTEKGNHLVDAFRYFVNLMHPDVVQVNKFAEACRTQEEAA